MFVHFLHIVFLSGVISTAVCVVQLDEEGDIQNPEKMYLHMYICTNRAIHTGIIRSGPGKKRWYSVIGG